MYSHMTVQPKTYKRCCSRVRSSVVQVVVLQLLLDLLLCFSAPFVMAAADEKFLKEAFEAFDTDKSGSIDLKELKAVMKSYFELVKEPADDKKVNDVSEKIMKAVDKGGDGKISLDEFIKAFK